MAGKLHPFQLHVDRINCHFSPNIFPTVSNRLLLRRLLLSPCNVSHNPTPRFRGRDSRDRSLNFAIHDRLAVPIHNPSHLCQGDRSRSALTDDYVGHLFFSPITVRQTTGRFCRTNRHFRSEPLLSFRFTVGCTLQQITIRSLTAAFRRVSNRFRPYKGFSPVYVLAILNQLPPHMYDFGICILGLPLPVYYMNV